MTAPAESPPPLSPEELAEGKRLTEIENRTAKATKGPWRRGSPDHMNFDPLDEHGRSLLSPTYEAEIIGRPEDVSFLYASRDDVPWLCERLRASAERERRLRELLAEAADVIAELEYPVQPGYGTEAEKTQRERVRGVSDRCRAAALSVEEPTDER